MIIVFKDKSPHISVEPLKLTLADMLAIVFGFAVFFALPPSDNLGGLAIYGFSIPTWLVALIWSVSILQGMALATSAATLARCFKYGRMPRPAEWLALVVGIHFLSRTVPDVDTLINGLWRIPGTPEGYSFGSWRWGIGGASLVLAATLFMLARQRTSWSCTALLCATLMLLMWGPCPVLALQLADLFPPLSGIGTGWFFWLAVNCVNLIGALPGCMIYGIPAVATYRERRHDRFGGLVWTEWVAMGCALTLGVMLLLLIVFPVFGADSISSMTERIVKVFGLVVVVLLSGLVVNSGIIGWSARNRAAHPVPD